MKDKIIKRIIFSLIIFIVTYIFNFMTSIDMDMIWNYGFSKNFADGLIMYKDFNMVITPLYPIIVGSFMKIFGINLVSFYVVNSLIMVLIMNLIYTLNKKTIIPIFLFAIFITQPNYNFLCLALYFLIIFLEKNKSNDYLIGLVLGLAFLTKNSVGGFLCLPTIYYLFKDYKKCFKRFIGFVIPNLIIIVWFYFNGSLYNYIDYTVLGLFSFSSNNTFITPLIIPVILAFIFLIYKYIKTKDILILYVLAFQIINYPIFNIYHFEVSLIPILFYLLDSNIIYKYMNKFNLLCAFLLVVPISGLIIKQFKTDYVNDDNVFKYRHIQKVYVDAEYSIKKHFNNNYNNVYFLMYESYMFKIMLNIPINEFDLLNNGNLGSAGSKGIIDKLDNLDDDSIFLISNVFQEGQHNKEVYDYVCDNYKYVEQFSYFMVYKK